MVSEPAQASPAQHGIWVSSQAGGDGRAYHLPLLLWFDGPLDVPALLDACTATVARHGILSSTVAEAGDALRQFPAASSPLVKVADRPADIERFLADQIALGFDLRKGPLIRFTLAPAGPGQHLLLVVAHHLVFDGTSKDILVRDLAAAYSARITGDAADLAPLDPSYAEAGAAQHRRIAAGLPAAREFWRRHWREPDEIVLPAQRRPPRLATEGDTVEAAVSDEAWQDATRTAKLLGVTPFEVLLAGLHTVLYRYGNDEIAIAVDMTTRGPQLNGHIGPFINELPVLSSPAADMPFSEFAATIRARMRELNQIREIPLAKAVPGLTPRAALAPVSVSYRRRGADPVFPWLKVAVRWMMFSQAVRSTLHLQVVDSPGGLGSSLQFDPGATDRATVIRLAGHLESVLRAAARTPHACLAELPLLSAAERACMLGLGEPAVAGYPPAATVVGMFRAQARATPDAVAVVCGDRSLSYRELDLAASRLARRLGHAGVAPGDLVAVHAERSAEMLVSLLAIGASGGCYLPLDPCYPHRRRDFILRDSGARLVLTTTDLAGQPCPVLRVDSADSSSGQPGEDPAGLAVDPGPADLAYVMYTSGSTGQPKGVAVEHRALANHLLAMKDALAAGPRDVWLSLTSLSFDISALELFLPLISGGRVVIAPPGTERDAAAALRLARDRGVTHIQATPSGWRVLLAGGGEVPPVTAISGGEALTPDLATGLQGQARQLLNAYGPTEATIWTTLAEVGVAAAPITIGRPLTNTRMYVLDDRMEPAPLGVPGELYVGGAGLARGYLHRPGLTAAAFVPDPFGPAGGRLYRTGDRGRLRPDGSVEFLGRLDDQVKLRGHRIELGEIEARLLDHLAVGQAAVLVSDGERAAELIAYLVPAGSGAEAAISDQDLRDHLAGTLPSIMVPRAFTWLEAFPLTPNGKADRKALSAAPRHRPARSEGPVTATQGRGQHVAETVTRIWEDILHVPGIGMDEDLFDLGGHSLTIVQIIARIRDRLGVDVPIDAFEDGATVQSVTRVVTRLKEGQ